MSEYVCVCGACVLVTRYTTNSQCAMAPSILFDNHTLACAVCVCVVCAVYCNIHIEAEVVRITESVLA